MRGNKRTKRIKDRIYDLLAQFENTPKKRKVFKSTRGLTIEAEHFRLINQITTDQTIAKIWRAK